MGIIPLRLIRPTVGLIPTKPFDDEGQTIDPSVSVPTPSAARFAEIPAPVPELDWGYRAQPLANGRVVDQHRGKLVGGSTMINGCMFVRGKPSDFTAWAAVAGEAWS